MVLGTLCDVDEETVSDPAREPLQGVNELVLRDLPLHLDDHRPVAVGA